MGHTLANDGSRKSHFQDTKISTYDDFLKDTNIKAIDDIFKEFGYSLKDFNTIEKYKNKF